MDQSSNLKAQFVEAQATPKTQISTPPFSIQHQHGNSFTLPIQSPMNMQITLSFPPPQLQAARHRSDSMQSSISTIQPMQEGPVFQQQLSLNQNPNPKGLVGVKQLKVMSESGEILEIEKKISMEYGFYVCLVYWELFMAIATIVYVLCTKLETPEIVLAILTAFTMIPACTLAILAKAEFETHKQRNAHLLFMLATLLSVATTVVSIFHLRRRNPDYDVESLLDILAIPAQFVIGIVLIISSRNLLKMMRDRDMLLIDIKAMADNSTLSFQV